MNRFLSPEPLQSQVKIELDVAESHHALHVMRQVVGDSILLVDGRGGLARGVIIRATKQMMVVIELIEKHLPPAPQILGFGIPKTAAMEFIIRRCTEVGVSCFQPLVTDHGLVPEHFNFDRWEKIAIETCKQCERTFFPKIQPPVTLTDFLKNRDAKTMLFYCSERRRSERPTSTCSPAFTVLVGPEGGWSERETLMLERAGGLPLGLGPHRLRVETAVLAAVLRLQFLAEAFSATRIT